MDAAVREREEELSRRTLQALLDMRIKFPGKTDEEAEIILESVSVGYFAVFFFEKYMRGFENHRSSLSRRGLSAYGILVYSLTICFIRYKITGSFISLEWLHIGW